MVATRVPREFTFEEYLDVERKSQFRSEFIHGGIYAMTGGSARHALICTNLTATLRQALKGKPCRAYSDALQLYVEAPQIGTYPDAAVYCGTLQFWRNRNDVALNPVIIAEVLSPGTEGYDRGEKFDAYKTIPTLQQYALIAQDRPRVEVFTRQGAEGWLLRTWDGLSANVELTGVGITLPMTELFDGVEA